MAENRKLEIFLLNRAEKNPHFVFLSLTEYNSPPGGCRVSVCLCVSPPFFTFYDGITSKRFELLS